MSVRHRTRRPTRAAGNPARRFEIVPILEIEANIPLLRAYRTKNRARFNQWKNYVLQQMKNLLSIVESPQSEETVLIGEELAMTGCKIGQTRLETKKDPTGTVWVRTCVDYWCQDETGTWVPNGTKCASWILFDALGMRLAPHAHEPEVGPFVDRGHDGHGDPPPRNGRRR